MAGGADTSGVKLELGQQTRLVFLVAVLGLVALAGGAFMLLRPKAETVVDITPSPTRPVATTTATARAPAKPQPRATKPKPAPAVPVPRPQPTTPVPTATTPATGLPVQIARALDDGEVVVVGLYAPGVKLDEAALREAQDGARRADAVFVPIDVNTKDIDQLSARFGALQDPAVLVLKPPADVVVRIDGFADRDTVAQAATDGYQ
jgi:hypothetical protein